MTSRRLPATNTLAAAAALLAAGCASAPEPWRIEPHYRVSHSMPVAAGQGYLALGRQYTGERRWSDALAAYRKAAIEAPDDVDVLSELGLAEAGQGQHARAIAALRRAAALAPQRVALLNNLGYALMLDGQQAAARDVLHQALALDPRHDRARANLADADLALAGSRPAPAVAIADVPVTPPVEPASPAWRVLTTPDVGALEVSLAPLARVAPVVPDAAPALTADAARLDVSTAVPAAQPARSPGVEQLVAVFEAKPQAPAAARIEIANGNGVRGLAGWLGRWLKHQGVGGQPRLANLPPYRVTVTTVHYGPGFADQARAIAHRLPGSVSLVADERASARADVRVVIGHDWRRIASCMDCAVPTRVVQADAASPSK